MKVGLFFGSFNPIHIGHMAIANYMVEYSDMQELWFIVSPQNPLKEKSTLLADYHRLELVNRAIEDDYRFKTSNIEFSLPKPSYTIDTLTHLNEKYPKNEFILIMGGDNLQNIHKWKNYKLLLENYDIYVYPRPNNNIEDFKKFDRVKIVNAPNMEISSTFIRSAVKEGKDIRHFLPQNTNKYIEEMNFYKK